MTTTDATSVDRSAARAARRSRARRRAAIATAILLLAVALLLSALVGSGSSSRDATGPGSGAAASAAGRGPDDAATPDSPEVIQLDSVEPTPVDPDGVSIGDDADGGGAPSGDEGPGDDEPDGPVEPEPADPCADALESGANLAVTPDPRVLGFGVQSSSLTVTNCGAADVDWSALTKPWVSLDDSEGTLAAGAAHQLGFTIDWAGQPDGPISFKIKVSEPGHNEYVDVHAHKAGLTAEPPAPEPDPDLGFSSGEDGGCALQCITKAWLTPNATTPNPSLEVRTTVPAKVAVYVSESAPVEDDDGDPLFPGVDPIAWSTSFDTEWTTVLKPLDPATSYHIIVKATDEEQHSAHRAGTFTTSTPAVDPDADLSLGDLGCSVQCITKAWLTPVEDSPDMDLEVETTAPAQLDVFVSEQAPEHDDDGIPHLPGVAPMATTDGAFETAWDTALEPLEGGTTYHVIVRATDEDGRTSHRVGSFETHDVVGSVLVSFHEVHVSHDGDSSPGNRGELELRFGVDGELVATRGEHKVSSGDTIGVEGATHLVEDVQLDGFLPLVTVAGLERDWDAKAEFCPMGLGVPQDWGRSDDCDLKWNVASSGLLAVSGLDSMATCAELGVDGLAADAPCVRIETASHGDDYPRFSVIVSFQLVD